jgi:hypothetical protein
MIGPKFESWGLNQTYVAGDGKSFWYYAVGNEDSRPNAKGNSFPMMVAHFEFFDGENWHDVQSELNLQQGTQPYTTSRSGRSMIVASRSDVNEIIFEGGKLRQTSITRLPPGFIGLAISHVLDGSDGEVWMRCAVQEGKLFLWNGQEFRNTQQNLVPKTRDGKGRAWFSGDIDGFIYVKAGGQWIKSAPKAYTMINTIAEGPDGRMWVVHEDGLSQVEVQGPSQKLAIKEVGRWDLGGPKNSVRDPFFDGNNGLWFAASGRRILRVELPRGTK